VAINSLFKHPHFHIRIFYLSILLLLQ
jgi:hypothetical protein